MASGVHHCKDCGLYFESGKSLEVHLNYHKENLLSRWATQATEGTADSKNGGGGGSGANRNSATPSATIGNHRDYHAENGTVDAGGGGYQQQQQNSNQFQQHEPPSSTVSPGLSVPAYVHHYGSPPPPSSQPAGFPTYQPMTTSDPKAGLIFHRPTPHLPATVTQPTALHTFGVILPHDNPICYPQTTAAPVFNQELYDPFKQHQRRQYHFHPYNGTLPHSPNQPYPQPKGIQVDSPPPQPPEQVFDPSREPYHQTLIVPKNIQSDFPFYDNKPTGNGNAEHPNGGGDLEASEILDLDSQKVVYQSTAGGIIIGTGGPGSPQINLHTPYPTPPPSGWGHPIWQPKTGNGSLEEGNKPSSMPPEVNVGYQQRLPSSSTVTPPPATYPVHNMHHHQQQQQQQQPPPPQPAAPAPQQQQPQVPPPASPSNPGWSGKGHPDPKRPKTYLCEICNKWFTSSGHLKRHYNTTLHKNAMRARGLPDPGENSPSPGHHPPPTPSTRQQPQPPPLPPPPPQQHQGENLSPPGYMAATSGGPPSTTDFAAISSPSISGVEDSSSSGSALTSGDDSGSSAGGRPANHHQQMRNGSEANGVHQMYHRGTDSPVSSYHPNEPMRVLIPHMGNYHHPEQLNLTSPDPASYPHYATNSVPIDNNKPCNNANRLPSFHPYQIDAENMNDPNHHNGGSDFSMARPYMNHHHQMELTNNNGLGPTDENNPYMLPMQDGQDKNQLSPNAVFSGDSSPSDEPDTTHEPDPPKGKFKKYTNGHYNNNNNIKKNNNNNNGRGHLKCKECGIVFKKASVLVQHNKHVHGGTGLYLCEMCNVQFDDQQQYEAHLKTSHEGQRIYPCTLCHKHFNHRTDLKRHLCTHTGQRPFECVTCKKRFIRKDHMRKHFEKHLEADGSAKAETSSADGFEN